MNKKTSQHSYALEIPITKNISPCLGKPSKKFLKFSTVKHRKLCYKGRGRPKKTDIIFIPYDEYEDYLLMEKVKYGCKPFYTLDNS